MVDSLLVFPDPPPSMLREVLDRRVLDSGQDPSPSPSSWRAVASEDEARRVEPPDGWAGAVVVASSARDDAFSFCRELRKRDFPVDPILLVVGAERLAVLGSLSEEDLFDDFVVADLGASRASEATEILFRLDRLLSRSSESGGAGARGGGGAGGAGVPAHLVLYGPLALNLETYQAALAGRPLDLTYMEYELLRFLAASPGKVFTREVLLSRVWGYEYFGGARTVDVHVRRLRVKLGEENAHLIQTVRSVGYRFGNARWLPPDAGREAAEQPSRAADL